ncbi:hypothetical protein COW81_00975 [Candidatus Campbellbacteria bacterium CG22_combo_CG10-13_8_21_14_all_36_13]|uniref:Type II secretion system protein GspG C-terminal domain-containing protein n=1 Tax=Candidatus Campbellbacteria bacterium CG22_combo_CG10-13_8_21_14_all_36_13 TaxID=1974529 RepID=A0A2H0DYM7_9BACT|nr:MAG: hypothetical protein COW81_00975 [Candidatus Campbellbacteria bacterium CG22_combo_CG10-13_8_21_14_all_36_13]
MRKLKSGFTLIELLVVIAIIGLLSSVVLASLNTARTKAKDVKRLSDMVQARKALALYYDKNGRYPTSDYDGCGGWDVGNQNYNFMGNMSSEFLADTPEDSKGTSNCDGYRYYRYSAGSYGCDASRGAYYVLGVTDMETSGRPHSQSPGWRCLNRNWQGEMDWVVGEFEN